MLVGGEVLDKITVQLPLDASDGRISLSTDDGTGESANPLIILDGLRIDNITPNPTLEGQTIVITGDGFNTDDVGGGDVEVVFNGVAAPQTPLFRSRTAIRIVVPTGVMNGLITITHPSGDVMSKIILTVDNTLPAVFEISPTLAIADDTEVVTLQGRNLQAATAVRFNGVASTNITPSEGLISATVPVGATPGPVTIDFPAAASIDAPETMRILDRTEVTLGVPIRGVGSGIGSVFVLGSSDMAQIVDVATLTLQPPFSIAGLLPTNSTIDSFQVHPDGSRGIITTISPERRTYVIDLPGITLRAACDDAAIGQSNKQPFKFGVQGEYAYALNPDSSGTNDGVLRLNVTTGACDTIDLGPPANGGVSGILAAGPGELLIGHNGDGAGLLNVLPGAIGEGSFITPYAGAPIDRTQLFYGPGGNHVWGRTPPSTASLARYRPFTNDPTFEIPSVQTGNSVQTTDLRFLFSGQSIFDLEREKLVRATVVGLNTEIGLGVHPTDQIFFSSNLFTNGLVKLEILE